MHCLPAQRGREVGDEVTGGAAERRLRPEGLHTGWRRWGQEGFSLAVRMQLASQGAGGPLGGIVAVERGSPVAPPACPLARS
jgi:hypothetical protein